MKVLVVDDHPVLREGISTLLCQSGPDTTVLQAGDAAEALAMVDMQADFDVVLLDLMMPGINGLSALAELGRTRPDLPIIVLSSSEDPHDARKAFAQGALGYVPKSARPETLLTAIRLVLNGDLYVPPLILDSQIRGSPTDRRPADKPVMAMLTDRQFEVLRRLCEGDSNKAIALTLDLAEKTVKAHVTAIFKALNVVSRSQAAAVARKTGLI